MSAAQPISPAARRQPGGAARATPRTTMRAVVHARYGEPDGVHVLRLGEVQRPAPGPREVLVRVHAANVSVGDHHVVTGKPDPIRLSPYGGLPRPHNRVPGTAMAGVVEALGAGVTGLRQGDEVYGEGRSGAFADYMVIPADRLAPKPGNLSFEEAAAATWAVTALQGLRDAGDLKAGQEVLVNGASGGLGTWAIQIARAMGGRVTAVCSTRNLELARALGAEAVVDYTRQDFVASGVRFDLMLDLVGNRTLTDCVRALKRRGTYVACSGAGSDWFGPMFRLAAVLLRSSVSRRKLTTFVASPGRKDLLLLNQIIEAGQARPVIEQVFDLADVAQALLHVGTGHSRGQTVVRVATV
jgi:NADPH:quinone reductase-like Zn-dependent oxidoreductase